MRISLWLILLIFASAALGSESFVLPVNVALGPNDVFTVKFHNPRKAQNIYWVMACGDDIWPSSPGIDAGDKDRAIAGGIKADEETYSMPRLNCRHINSYIIDNYSKDFHRGDPRFPLGGTDVTADLFINDVKLSHFDRQSNGHFYFDATIYGTAFNLYPNN